MTEDAGGRGATPRPATTLNDAVTVPDPGDSARRLCRICRRRTRPVVPVGCCSGWDMCYRCYRGVTALRRRSEPAAVEAWARRIAEVAELAEARWVA